MCTAIVLLNGDVIDSPRKLLELLPDGDPVFVGHDLDSCLCGTEIEEYLFGVPRRFMRGHCVLASIFADWCEVDTEGRTFNDAFEFTPDDEYDLIVNVTRRNDWPHGFASVYLDRFRTATNNPKPA